VAGIVCLLAAAVTVAGYQTTTASPVWPAAIALAPLVGLIVAVERYRRPAVTVAALAVGAAGLAVFSTVMLSAVPEVSATSDFAITAAKLGLVLVVGGGSTGLAIMAWMAAGLLASEGVVAGAAVISGAAYRYDASPARAFVLVSVIVGVSALVRRRAREAQPTLHRAAQAEELEGNRATMESRAAALLHDTVLNDLVAISGSSPGRMKDELRTRINADLELLVGQDWLGVPGAMLDDGGAGKGDGLLAEALDEARASGMDITVTGALSSLSRLTPDVAHALALAVRQCLVNIHKHANTRHAELVVSSSPTEVSVMVVDSGSGFDPRAVHASRLGLRRSVVDRMRDVGGVAQVWSTPGQGTSIFIAVPLDGAGPSFAG